MTVAVGHGKKAARCVGAYLRGERYVGPSKHALASFDRLNAWYYEDAPATVRPTLEAARRVKNFEGVVGGLDETNALCEARRCLSCGNLLRMRQLLRRLPRQCRHQARAAQEAQVRLRLLQGLRNVR